MPRPIVEVLQTVENIQTTVTDPEQATLLVGPHYDVLSYAQNLESSKKELARVDNFDPYDSAHTASFGSHEFDLSASGAIDADSVKVYFEDVSVEVGASGLESVITSTYDASAANLAAMRTNVSQWSSQLYYDSNSFVDSSHDYPPRAGDTVVIEYKLANVFVPSVPFTSAQLTHLGADNGYVKIEIGDLGAQKVYHHYDRLNMLSGFSANSLDLFEAFDESEVFSHLNGGAIEYGADTSAILTIYDNTDGLLHTVNGKMVIPEDQVTTLRDTPTGDTIVLTDNLRQFVSSHLNDSDQLASVRIERKLVNDYPDATSVYIGPSTDWSFTAATSSDLAKLTFSSDVTLQDTGLPNAAALDDLKITFAKMYVARRSLVETNVNSVFTVNSLNRQSLLGEAVSDNPLGLAASVALANSGSSSISVLRINADSAAGYAAASPFIDANPDVYAITPLTQDQNVISSYATAAAAQSSSKVGKFRIVLGTAQSAPLFRYWAGNRNSEYSWVDSNLATGTISHGNWAAQDAAVDAVIQDPEGSFLSLGGPAVGDTVVFSDNATATQYSGSVSSIDSNSSLTVRLETLPAGTAQINARVNSSIVYVGKKDIQADKDAQVEDLISVITPLTSNVDTARRLVMVYPGQVNVGEEAGLPGYYLTAALGGMLAAFEPHRPKNQIAVSGIADIEYSNLGYFSDSQIDRLSDSGYFVFIQETPGGLPFCVHQVTAAYRDYASTQEYSELSVANTFDYVSSVFKSSLQPYVGVWNIIPQAFSSIAASLDSAILSLQSENSDRIGAPLISGTIVTVEPSEADAGTVNVVLEVQLPRVLNKIVLEIVSQ